MSKRAAKRYAVILNRGAGSIRGLGPGQVAAEIEAKLRAAGRQSVVRLLDGPAMGRAIAAHVQARDVDALIVGGGDGTASTSAGQLVGSGIAMGILPLGTMNLYARSLGIPLDLDAAIDALLGAKARMADIGRINGRPFLHQVSFGLQPRLAQLRETMAYGSRMGKMLASLKALWMALRQPPSLTLQLDVQGQARILTTSALVISNNQLGPGHLPYADILDGGVLGIYASTSSRWRDLVKLSADVMLGNWQNNPHLESHAVARLTVERLGRARGTVRATIDGELVKLRGRIEIASEPRALAVLVAGPCA